MWPYLLQGLGLGLPAAVQPGPFQAYLLSQVTRQGWQKTLPAALAPLISDSPIIAITALLLSQLPGNALIWIKIFGGGFILYLAWGAIRGFLAASAPETIEPDDGRGSQSVLQASVMNFLNPNPWIFWGTIGSPILIGAWELSAGFAIAFILGMYVTLIGGMALLVFIFGQVGALSPSANRWMNGVAALALLAFGIWQLTTGISALMG